MFDSEILSLYTPWDLQDAIRDFLLERRKVLKKSRRSLAEQSGIPAPTIRRFEETGEISFRRGERCSLCKLCLNSLRTRKRMPKTMKEVLDSDY